MWNLILSFIQPFLTIIPLYTFLFSLLCLISYLIKFFPLFPDYFSNYTLHFTGLFLFILTRFGYYILNKWYRNLLDKFQLSPVYIGMHNYYYIIRRKFRGKNKENLTHFSYHSIRIKIIKTNDKHPSELIKENINLREEIDIMYKELKINNFEDSQLLEKYIEKMGKLNGNNIELEKSSKS